MAGWKPKSVEQKDSVEGPAKVVSAGGTHKPGEDGKLTPGQWAANYGTEAHWLAGAAAGEKWGIHDQLTEDEYKKAIDRAKNHTFGHHSEFKPEKG